MSQLPYPGSFPPAPYGAPDQPLFVPSLLGPLQLVTPPTGRVLDVPEAKLHLRIPGDQDDEDEYLDGLIEAATLAVEESIPGHRQLLTAAWDVPVRCWWQGGLKLPRPPLQSVTVSYYDQAGVLQTLDPSLYVVRAPTRGPGVLRRAPNQSWPALQVDRDYPVLVHMTSGYGTGNNVPATLRQAVRLWVADAFENRGDAPGQAALDAFNRLCDLAGYGAYP